MKRMRRSLAAVLVVGSGLFLSGLEAGEAQVRGRVADACPEGLEEGSLGISGLDCVGECTLTIRGEGDDRLWSFSTEPRIIGIETRGPADGILETGDFLVAIDGVLITTRAGGRRYANLQPGERVTVRYRREGQVREGTITVGSSCREVPERVGVAARVAPLPTPPDEPLSVGIPVVAPRVRVATARGVPDVAKVATGVSVARRAPRGLLAGSIPTGKLGIGFQCSDCGTRAAQGSDEEIWFFSGPLSVTAVNEGGPADEAGIKRGDLIKSIDGKDITTEEGGLAFTRITPGVSVRLTVVRRNGTEADVSLVPEEARVVGLAAERGVAPPAEPRRPTGVTAGVREPVQRADRARPLPPTAPDRVTVPVPVEEIEPPPGMPLRYSGTVDGVEVEVRGEPVTVSEFEGRRTIYINAEGLWIRITVPGRRGLPGGETVRVESGIRR